MKKILFSLLVLSATPAFCYTEVDSSHGAALTSAVSVSTTPALFVSSSTKLDLEQVKIWSLTSDVIYLNFNVPTSSTTAAASGIKLFQSDKNDGHLTLDINRFVGMYMTLAADSGTSSLRILELGRKK